MVIHFAASAAAALKALQRQCPHCGNKQVVSPEKKNEAVRCEKCGAEIPPGKNGGATS